MPPNRKRRWHQFSIRALLIVMLLCALGTFGWVRYIEPFRHEQEAMARLMELGGKVNVDPVPIGWLGRWFDDDQFAVIRSIDLATTSVTDADLRCIQNLPRLSSLRLRQTRIGDQGLNHLNGLPELVNLELDMTDVTDAGLRSLGQFRRLTALSLTDTQITDQGLDTIGQLRELQVLDLRNTRITDAGMPHLGQLKSLVSLNLSGTEIGDDGLEKLAALGSLLALDLTNTEVSESSLPLLTSLSRLNGLNVDGTRIIPATFCRAFPDLANASAHDNSSGFSGNGNSRAPATIELNDVAYADVLDHWSNHHRVTIVPSPSAVQWLAAEDSPGFTASLQDSSLIDKLRQLFTPRGLRPVVRYGCVQLITSADSVREHCRMVVADPQDVSRPLSQRLYRGCPPLDGLYRNELLAPHKGANLEQLRQLVPRSYRWRLADLTAAMTDMGLKNELDEAAFAERSELRSREIFVPSKWHCSLGSALECMFYLFDVHGVVHGDTIHLRPGAALE